MLAKKKKIAHFLSSQDRGLEGRGGQIKIYFKIPKMSDFFYWTGEKMNQKNRSFLRIWRQKGGGAANLTLSSEDKIWAIFFFASIPYSLVTQVEHQISSSFWCSTRPSVDAWNELVPSTSSFGDCYVEVITLGMLAKKNRSYFVFWRQC